MVVPFVWMVLGSFKTTAELRQLPPTWIPENPTSENYSELFTRLDFPRYFFNSTVVAVGITLGNIVIGSMTRLRPGQAGLLGKAGAFPPGARHASGARSCALPPPVRPDQQPGAGQHPPRAHLPLPRRPSRCVPDAPVHAQHPRRSAPGGTGGRGGEYRIFCHGGDAALRSGAGHPGDHHLPRRLERLPVAVGGGHHRGPVHAAGGARICSPSASRRPTSGCSWPDRWW